jgi:predicted dithiol-disulfide oxidoreductase (DUF899 family)
MKVKEMERETEASQINRPRIVSPQEWEAARQKLLVKEKELTRARDALAAERRRMSLTGPRARRACSTCSTAAVN